VESNLKVQINLPKLGEEGSIWLHSEIVLAIEEHSLRSTEPMEISQGIHSVNL
jgi:hypothetical protein